MTACSWHRSCPVTATHLVWRRTGLGELVTEVVCAGHRSDAEARGYRHGTAAGGGTERLALSATELRTVAGIVAAGETIEVDLPPEAASVVRHRRRSAVPPCTWDATCPGVGTVRVEHPEITGGSVEFVCPDHVEAAAGKGYKQHDPVSGT